MTLPRPASTGLLHIRGSASPSRSGSWPPSPAFGSRSNFGKAWNIGGTPERARAASPDAGPRVSTSSFVPFHERDAPRNDYQSFHDWRVATCRTPETTLKRYRQGASAERLPSLARSPRPVRASTPTLLKPMHLPPTPKEKTFGSELPDFSASRQLHQPRAARLSKELKEADRVDSSLGVGVVYGIKAHWDARPTKTLTGVLGFSR